MMRRRFMLWLLTAVVVGLIAVLAGGFGFYDVPVGWLGGVRALGGFRFV